MPDATGACSICARSSKYWNNSCPCTGGAAAAKLGRLPALQSAASVNWLTSNRPPALPWPSTFCTLWFILPFSSLKTRNFNILANRRSAVSCVSCGSAQTNTSRPCPMAPTVRPSTVTRASRTRCSTAFTIAPHHQRTAGQAPLRATWITPPSHRKLGAHHVQMFPVSAPSLVP